MNEKPPKIENDLEKPRIKEGVDFIFTENPVLAEIGTKEQYSQHLDKIFPESKIKDIVWHGSKEKVENFDKNRVGENTGNKVKGIFLTTNPKIASDYNPVLHGVLINLQGDKYDSNTLSEIKKILKIDLEGKIDRDQIDEIDSLTLNDIEEYTRNENETGKVFEDYLLQAGVTGEKFKENDNLEYYDFDQIHILGSKSDIKKFKEFVG